MELLKQKITDGSVLDTYFREETIAEHTASKYNNFIAKDINTFKESVKSNGGYYFARYEAGDPTTETNRQSSSLQTVVPVFKNNQVAYDYIAQRNAAERTRELYTNQSTNYISDLINSYSWDTTLIFIQEFSGDPDYSMQGCLQLNTSARTGQATDGENKDVRCNIYDMAGNVREASTETMYNPAPGVSRGGIYLNNNLRASGRANQVATSIIVSEGFRRNYIHFK